MSRSGYIDDGCDSPEEQWALIRYRGAVTSALRGKRGQALLREAAGAMDAMPKKELAADSLVTASGEFCTLGVVGAARGLDMSKIDPEDWNQVASHFNIAPALVREIVFENDECGRSQRWDEKKKAWIDETPAERWRRMRVWVASQISDVSQ